MNFCFSVCEYDPLHNGHVYHLNEMKKTEKDAIAIMMSGNFTQRGEMALLDKYTRAKHAILAGADIVFELPTVFSTAPAEIFAGEAVRLFSQIDGNNIICFGSESGSKEDYYNMARALLNETKIFREVLKKKLSLGMPYAQARYEALKETGGELNYDMLVAPNSVLGLEYTKSIIINKSRLDILPIPRQGSGYKNKKLGKEDYCSSSAIRQSIVNDNVKKAKNFMPSFVYHDLPKNLPDIGKITLYSLIRSTTHSLREIIDCSEGLENRIKAFSKGSLDYTSLIDKLETRRYTRARLQRIVTSCLLGIDRSLVARCTKNPLYLKVLAIASDKLNILSEISKSKVKLLTRKGDCDSLTGVQKECFNIDVLSCDLYNLVTDSKINEYEMKIIER